MKERGMAGALGRSEPAERGLDSDVNERRDASTLAGGERALSRARLAAVKPITVEQGGGRADTPILTFWSRSAVLDPMLRR